MITEPQYNQLAPFKDMIALSQSIGSCISSRNCSQLADIHEANGWGPINRTCSGCLTDMVKTLHALILEYEDRK